MIRARGLEKRYGARRVLAGLSFDVAAGEALLVTGPNGSGKTTLLRLLAGLAAPTRGTLELELPRGRLGYLGHEPLVYRDLTALENLELYGRLYRVPERRERMGMLLERLDLWAARNDRVASYSRGMVQRLAGRHVEGQTSKYPARAVPLLQPARRDHGRLPAFRPPTRPQGVSTTPEFTLPGRT